MILTVRGFKPTTVPLQGLEIQYQSNTETHYQLYEPLIRLAHFSNSKTKREAINTTMKGILSTVISVTNVVP